MSAKMTYQPSPVHLALEIMGSIMAGLGLAEIYAQTNLVPQAWQFEHYGWYMVVIGLLLGIPHMAGIIRHARMKTNAKND